MAENEDGQEKSQEPTGKRLADAKKKGQVPRSRELNTMAVTLIGLVTVIGLGGHFSSGMSEVLNNNFVLSREDVMDPSAVISHLSAALIDAALLLAPFFGVVMTVALLASIALGGFNVSTESMTPNLGKLNPIKGLKKVFSLRGLLELVKSLAKFLLIGGATALVLQLTIDDFIQLGNQDLKIAVQQMIGLIGWSAVVITSTLILMALIDVPFQLWDHKRQLKMTLKEVRDEMKDTEGRPEVKGRIRQLQREAAMRRMMEEVPKADVIVTNPTHFAVALRYDEDRMAAPIVVAKGSDLVAGNIRRVAEEHRVPLVESPMLARAIYYSTELDHPIPGGLYLAVAQLLAYVYQLQVHIPGRDEPLQQPDDFPVPEEFRYDVKGRRMH